MLTTKHLISSGSNTAKPYFWGEKTAYSRARVERSSIGGQILKAQVDWNYRQNSRSKESIAPGALIVEQLKGLTAKKKAIAMASKTQRMLRKVF